jgi:hypothetical protein
MSKNIFCLIVSTDIKLFYQSANLVKISSRKLSSFLIKLNFNSLSTNMFPAARKKQQPTHRFFCGEIAVSFFMYRQQVTTYAKLAG